MKLLALLISLPLMACGATFEAAPADADSAGASGDDGASGAESGGSGGSSQAAGSSSVAGAGKPQGRAGAGSAGNGGSGAAGSAGAPVTAGSGGTLAGGAGAGGSSGSPPVVGGSAGTDSGMAGAAGSVEVPPDPPSCTVAEAFARASAPDALLLPAWASTNESDNVCWQGADRVCTFTLGEWSLSDDGKTGRLSVKEITCDKPLYFGTPKDGVCEDQTDCQVFMGSSADMAVVDFGLAADGDGYVASDFRVKAASSSGGLSSCDLSASTLTDELGAAVVDMLSMVSFSCGAQ